MTTILSVRRNGVVAVGGDGQVTQGNTIMKSDTRKVRWLMERRVIAGFAGTTADALALIEKFEARLKNHPGHLLRAATELARDWRADRVLRKLDALLIAADAEHSLLISGTGDVIQPADGVLGIGTGGPYAVAAARALLRHSELPAAEIVRESLRIASELDVFTNDNIIIEELPCGS